MSKKTNLSNTTGTVIEVKFFDKYVMTHRERYLWLMARIQRTTFARMPHTYRSAAIAAASESLIRWKEETKADELLSGMRVQPFANKIEAKRLPHLYAMKAMNRNNARMRVKYGRRG